MKICFFNDITILGGGELWVLKAVEKLRLSGHEPHVICPWRSHLYHECLQRKIPVYGYQRGGGIPFYEPTSFYLRKHKIDILYCTIIGQFNEARVLGTMVQELNQEREAHERILLYLKTGLPPMGISVDHYGLGTGAHVPALHVVSEEVRAAFLDWCPALGENFVCTQLEGVDLEKFSGQQIDRSTAKEYWGYADERPVITNLARLHPLKGQDNLLLATPAILKEYPDAVFLFAGTGGEEERLKRLAKHLDIDYAVRFLGHIEEVPLLLAATDVLCHPSLADGMPNSIVESMAMEIPVVASRVGGISDVVKHESTGLLIEPHDIKAISVSVNRLLGDLELRQNLGRHARTVVTETFDLAQNTWELARSMHEELQKFRAAEGDVKLSSERCLSVLFLFNCLRTGGEETELAILSKYLDRHKYQLSALSLFPAQEDCPVMDSLATYGVSVDQSCHDLADWNAKGSYVINKIKEHPFDIVVACQDAVFAEQVFAHLPSDQHVLIEHGGIVGEALATQKAATFRYIGVSPAIQDAAASGMKDPSMARYIPSMVDTSEYQGQDRMGLREAYGVPKQSVILTFVGRLDPKKRVEHLIESARALIPKHPELIVMIVGGADAFQPEYANQLHHLAAAANLGGQLIFTGSRNDVPQLLCASDILVLPSVGEGMSHVINEAGAAGLAVISTRDGAAELQLENGQVGVLIDPDDSTALTSAIGHLLTHPEERLTLGRRLKQKVEREFSAHAVIPQWEAIFAEAKAVLPRAHNFYIQRYDQTYDFPMEIQIQTTTLCNATCVMCPYPEVSKEFPVGKMSDDLYQKILAECSTEKGLRRIEPFLMNEAFIDKRMPEMIAQAKQMVPHAAVTVTTNGTPLVPKVTDRLIDAGLDAIWFSFNGATPATYEKIMGIPYEKVKANIEYLLQTKPESLQVFINMIETIPMAGEIEENIAYWKSLGIQAGSSPLVNRGGNVKNFAELNYKAISEVPVRTCELVFYKMYILHNGDAILCCMDWRRNVVLGNVYEKSIREIWNGEVYQEIRRKHIEGRDGEIDLCANCSYTLN